MEPNKGPSTEPLPNGGLQILTDLITHQDSTTWTALSIFLAAEIVLLALYVQGLSATLNIATMGNLGAFGIIITIVSWFILSRSNRYLKAYYDLAKERANPRDYEIFDVKIAKLPRTGLMLWVLHLAFLLLWVTLFIVYLVVLGVLSVG